jgi:hypothetical protein
VNIPDYFVKMWMMDGATVNLYQLSALTGYSQIAPANPMRAAVILGSNSTIAVNWAFAENVTAVLQGLAAYAGGQQPLVLCYDQVGPLLRFPIWVKATTGGSNVQLSEISFSPEKYARMRRMVHEWLSQSPTP